MPSSSTTAPTRPASSSPSTAGATITIQIVEPSKNFNSWTYTPGTMTVHVGDKIVWTNMGQAAHTVTADDKASFDSGTLEKKAQFTWVATKAGTFPYLCTFYPWMKATITLTG